MWSGKHIVKNYAVASAFAKVPNRQSKETRSACSEGVRDQSETKQAIRLESSTVVWTTARIPTPSPGVVVVDCGPPAVVEPEGVPPAVLHGK